MKHLIENMKAKDKRLSELYKWTSQKPERQNIPTIIEHAIKRYMVTEHTVRNYAIAIMVKLGLLSKSIKVLDFSARVSTQSSPWGRNGIE